MTQKTVRYEKSLDYATVYADGIIFEHGNNGVSRLIFYQKEPQISEDSRDFDRTEEVKRLKFEVRIPHFAIGNVSKNVQYRQNFQSKTIRMVEATKDEKILDEYFNLSKELSEILFDSESFESDSPNALELRSVNDRLEALVGRVMKKIMDDKNGKHTEV